MTRKKAPLIPSLTLSSVLSTSGHVFISDLRYQDLNPPAQKLCDKYHAVLLMNQGVHKLIFAPGYAIRPAPPTMDVVDELDARDREAWRHQE